MALSVLLDEYCKIRPQNLIVFMAALAMAARLALIPAATKRAIFVLHCAMAVCPVAMAQAIISSYALAMFVNLTLVMIGLPE
jgi:hypothetical protein